jgi:hypothetical protein
MPPVAVAAGDDRAAEVVLPDPPAIPDEVLLDPQATVTSPAAAATTQTFQAGRASVIPLMSARHRLSRATGPHPCGGLPAIGTTKRPRIP